MMIRTIFFKTARGTLALLAGMALVCGPLGQAQSTTSARLSGEVTDASGAVVPNAQVTALDTDTNLAATATSDDAGNYAFNSLPVGHYKVTAAATGFETLVETGIELTVGHAEPAHEDRRTDRDDYRIEWRRSDQHHHRRPQPDRR
jgi:hypothetical protein